MGALTGLSAVVVTQQSGHSPLSIANGIKGMLIGGGLTFGVGYSLGAIRTYLKPPLPEPEPEAAEPEVAPQPEPEPEPGAAEDIGPGDV